MPSPGFSLRLKEKSGLGELSQKEQGTGPNCNPVGTEAPGWCTTEVPPAPSPGFCSNLWYHTAGPNRIPTIPTLGWVSSWFHVANWKPLEEIHIGIQTPEHLAKPSPAGLCMRRWPPLQPQPISPRQWPALPLLDKRPLCPLTYSTQMSKHALAHRMSSQRVIFFKSCSKT